MHRFIAWTDDTRTRARAESLDDAGEDVQSLDVLVVDGRARLRPRDALQSDPGLVDALCRRLAREGVVQVVLDADVEDAESLGFHRGEQHLLLASDLPLAPADAGNDAGRPPVSEVGLSDPGVVALIATALQGSDLGRPSGSELLAGLAGAAGVRAWAAGSPPLAAYVTQTDGATCHVAVAARGQDAPVGLVSDLVRVAEAAAVADGANRMTATVAESNSRSRRLCERFGLQVAATRHWWCRDL